jgi:hypothetical protein
MTCTPKLLTAGAWLLLFALACCSTNPSTSASTPQHRELSPILRNLETAGKIQIVGCIYKLETDCVQFLQ